jgi:hypothetical protein
LIANSGFSELESRPMPFFWDAVRSIDHAVFKYDGHT